MADLKGFRVALIAGDGVEEVELVAPRDALRAAGAVVELVTPKGKSIQAFNRFDKSDKLMADRTLENVSADDFDGIVLPGGTLNADQLRMNERLRELVRVFDGEGKPIAAICHAPWILVSAGVVRRRELTSYETLQDDIRNAGGQWVDRECVRNGNWVTSRKPADLEAFNSAAIALFGESRGGRLRERPSGVHADEYPPGASHPSTNNLQP